MKLALNPVMIVLAVNKIIGVMKEVERVGEIIDNEKCLVKIAEQNGTPREFDVEGTVKTINEDKTISFNVTEDTVINLRDKKPEGKINLFMDVAADEIHDETGFPAEELVPLVNFFVKLLFPKK